MEEIDKFKEAIDLWLKNKSISEIGLKLSRSGYFSIISSVIAQKLSRC